jgi:hypothetical protein
MVFYEGNFKNIVTLRTCGGTFLFPDVIMLESILAVFSIELDFQATGYGLAHGRLMGTSPGEEINLSALSCFLLTLASNSKRIAGLHACGRGDLV